MNVVREMKNCCDIVRYDHCDGKEKQLCKRHHKSEGLPGVLGNRGTKLYKLEDENIASKFIKRGTNKENVWEHGT